MNKATSLLNSVSWTSLSTLLKVLLQFMSFIVMSRFLNLHELGILAFITLLVSLSQIISDSGLSNALIYFKGLSLNQKKQLFVIGQGLSLVMIVGVLALLPWLESFFSLSTLTSYSMWVGFILFLRNLNAHPQAILQRRLEFKAIALVELSASLIAFIFLLILLNQNMGVQAVLASHVVNASVMVASMCILTRKELGVAFPHFKLLKAPMLYGIYQSGEGILSFISRQFDQLIVAKFLGSEVLGVYAYLKELVSKPALQLINPVVNRISFPLLVSKNTSQRGSFYLNTLFILTCLNMPLYFGLYAYSETVLALLLGAKWVEHADLFSMLSLMMLLLALINPCGALLQAVGAVRRAFYWNLFIVIVRSAWMLYGIQFGLIWLITSLVFLQLVILIVHWFILIHPFTHIPLRQLLIVLTPPILFTLASYVLSDVIASLLTLSGFWAGIFFAVQSGGILGWLLLKKMPRMAQ